MRYYSQTDFKKFTCIYKETTFLYNIWQCKLFITSSNYEIEIKWLETTANT